MKANKNSGFAILWALIFLPLGIFCLCALMYLSAWIKPQELTLQICRSNLLEGLAEISVGLGDFLKMNIQVLALRQDRTQAELELKMAIASTDEPAIVAAEEHLRGVTVQQESLRNDQNSKLENLNLRLREIQERTQAKIQGSQRNWSQQTKGYFIYSGANGFSSQPRLAVSATASPDSGPPTYQLHDDFIKNQAVHVSWKHQIQPQQQGANPWQQNSMSQQNECGASLKPTGSGFQPILFAGKS